MTRLLPRGRHRWAAAWASPLLSCNELGECSARGSRRALSGASDPASESGSGSVGEDEGAACGDVEGCQCTLHIKDDRGERVYNASVTSDSDPTDGLVVSEGEYLSNSSDATISFVETGSAVRRRVKSGRLIGCVLAHVTTH